MTYRSHGYVPSDDEIARLGVKAYEAFGPRRPLFVPSEEDFKRAAGDLAPGDDGEEYAAVAEALDISHLEDDDEDDYDAWVVRASTPVDVMRSTVELWRRVGSAYVDGWRSVMFGQ